AAIQGYYKFAPVGGDLLIITAIIYEQGSTVGFGERVIPDPAASYTQFTMDLEYYNPTISPDTCWIQIFLLDTATGQANIGSEYLLDDLSFAGTVDISDNVQPVIPENVSLRQNFPNPFNPSTAISFRLPKPAEVSLVVYNITGEEVIRILNGERLNAGEHTVNWTARNLPSGTYFYQLITGTGVLSRKMVLIK
ncbi:MAG: T9SS C-terminal target domain-containing protein, partial [Calditrichaeota bacterium]